MIRIQDLRFDYSDGEFELSIAEMQIEPGSTTAVIGPSGSGKTTLLNLIAGIFPPAAGRIRTASTELTELSDRERRRFRVSKIGLVFQEFELLEYLSVRDNIILPYRIHSALPLDRSVRRRTVELATLVGIADKLERFPAQLSQGERQRVAVCRAIVTEPALILADEPTGNLDPDNSGRVLDILFEYARRTSATFLAVTHDHELLPRFGRVIDLARLQT